MPSPELIHASPARWEATVTYRSDAGPIEVDYVLVEIADLHHLIERGPHWDTIIGIKIRRVNPLAHGITIEQAEAL